MAKIHTLTDFEMEVRKHIEGCGVPYKELAERTGVHANQIGRFMRGERGLTSWSLGRIIDFLGMQLSPPKVVWNVPPEAAGRPKQVLSGKAAASARSSA